MMLGRGAAVESARMPPGIASVAPLDEPDNVAATPERVTAAQRLRDALYRRICNGEIRRGEALPSVKYLTREYRVSRRTVVAAYRMLRTEGRIEKVGKVFWCGGPPIERPRVRQRKDVFLFTDSTGDLTHLFANPYYGAAYRAFEETLARHGFLVRYSPVERLEAVVRSWKRTHRVPHGIAFSDLGGSGHVNPKELLTQSGFGALPGRTPVLIDLRAKVTRRQTPAAAAGIHGRAVFFVHRPALSQTVREELARFIAADNPSAVSMVIPEDFLIPHRSGTPHGSGYYPAGRPPFWVLWDFVDLRKRLRALAPTMPVRLSVLRGNQGRCLDEPSLRSRIEVHEHAVAFERPVFGPEELTVCAGVDTIPQPSSGRELWVLRTDRDAAEALACAERRGARVPDRLSIVSLDNDPAYYHLGLTRCELDWERLGYQMAHAIVGDFPVPRTREGCLRVAARVVEKLTTR